MTLICHNFWKVLWIQSAVLFIMFQILVLTDLVHWFGWESPSSPSFIVKLEVYTSTLLLGEPFKGKAGDPWWIKINYTILNAALSELIYTTITESLITYMHVNCSLNHKVYIKYNTHIKLFGELKNVTLIMIFSSCATMDENDLLCK